MQGVSDESALDELVSAAEPPFLEQMQRLLADPERHVHSAELLELAREQDPTFPARLIADFPKWGLLALTQTEGRRANEGVGRYRPAIQVVTFIQVVHKRKQGMRRRSELANLPVLSWLIGGDQLVPLEQARRAVTTWAEANRKLTAQRKASDVRRTVLRYPQVRKLIADGSLTKNDISTTTLDALRARDNRALAEVIARATHPDRELDVAELEAEITKHQQTLDLIAVAARALPDVSDELLLAGRTRYHALHHELVQALGDGSVDADGVQLLKDEAAHSCANLALMIGAELEASAHNQARADVFDASADAGLEFERHMKALSDERERIANTDRRRRERIKARRR
jgi:hypothetical protein